MLSEDRACQRNKAKYQLIEVSMEDKLNQILESQNCSIKNIRLSSHECTQTVNTPHDQENNIKSSKKVMFQSVSKAEQTPNPRKDTPNLQSSCLRSRNNLTPSHSKTYKSLNCSFIGGIVKSESKSNRSIRTMNNELPEARKLATQILKKISIFLKTQITPKQIIEWLQAYCQKERAILLKLFLKIKKLSCYKTGKIKAHICSLQLDEDVLHAQLEVKLKDGLGTERYVKANELSELSVYFERVFVEKMKIKTKEFQESIASKMRNICDKIRKEEDNEYILNVRKKPIEIADFLNDVNHFENCYGSLKKINSLNRIRFKMLNDTDLVINRHVKEINERNEALKKIQIDVA